MQQTKYFDFWTDEENELINERKTFAIAISFRNSKSVCTTLYEYDSLLTDLVNTLNSDMMSYEQYHLVHFRIEDKFVVIKFDGLTETASVISQWGSFHQGEESIKKDCLIRSLLQEQQPNKNYDLDENTEYAIIDLSRLDPYFFGEGILVKRNSIVSISDI